jgi:DNA-binding CsgD family transcriptional regulator
MQTENTQFSFREKEVVELLLQGKSNKQIALALAISESTVEFHLKNVYKKLQVSSRTEAVLRLGKSTGNGISDELGESTVVITRKQRESIVDGTSENAENVGNTIPQKRISIMKNFYLIGIGLLLALFIVIAAIVGRPIFRTALSAAGTQDSEIIPTETPVVIMLEGTPGLMSNMGVSFVFPTGLGGGTENEIVPLANDYNQWPQHVKLTLVDYPLSGTVVTTQPQIMVFPANQFAQMGDCPKSEIDGLKEVLATQNTELSQPLPCSSVADSLPFLPEPHAAQVFHAQEKFLDFKNGKGIRYIFQLSQAHYPVIDADSLYTFQGLTGDGKYYVSVMLPVHIDSLDGASQPSDNIQIMNDQEYADYRNAMIGQISQANASINPSLESLDSLVQSLSVDLSGLIEMQPTSSQDTTTTASNQPIIFQPLDYCFAVPQGFTQLINDLQVEVIGPHSGVGGLSAGLVWIDAIDAQGRSALEVADEEVNVFGGSPTRSTVMLGGEEALVLDGMPGQDPIRKVYLVHNGLLYTLNFSHDSSSDTAKVQMETLFESVISSWVWMSSGTSCPLTD